MKYDPDLHHRRSIRLPGYDYRQAGLYFVTLCVRGRECLFGEIANGDIRLNELGSVVAESWRWLAERYPYIELGAWMVMPNHLHGLIVLANGGELGAVRRPAQPTASGQSAGFSQVSRGGEPVGGSRTAPTTAMDDGPIQRKSIGSLVGAFKTVSTKRVNQLLGLPGTPLWQRDFYDRIVRNERELHFIEDYIVRNPATWEADQLHPTNPSKW